MTPRHVIPLPPADYDTPAAAMFLAQHLKAAGRADLAALLVRNEKRERADAKPKRKAKQVLFTPRGRKIELYRAVVRELEDKS